MATPKLQVEPKYKQECIENFFLKLFLNFRFVLKTKSEYVARAI